MKVRCAWLAVLLAGLALVAGCLSSADVSGFVLLSGGTRSPIRVEASPAAPALTPVVTPESIVPGEIVVSYSLQEAPRLAEPVVVHLGGRRLRASRDDRESAFAVYRFPHASAAIQARTRLEQIPGVKCVEPNYRVEAQGIVDTSSELPDTLWNLKRVRVPGAWGITEGRSDVVVAVLDTGFMLDHPNLAGAWTDAKSNFVDPGHEDDPSVLDPTHELARHGTHVAGIIGARAGAGEVIGVAPGVKLMPVKVLGDDGSGSLATVADAIRWATDRGANVINLSLGSSSASSYMDDAIQYAHDHGVVIVAAAGNGGSDTPIQYPARNENVIAVGAVDASDVRAGFSSIGKELDVMAPGTLAYAADTSRGIYSTIVNSAGSPDYGYMSGTSMAAPHISGLVALMMSAGITGPDNILSLLKSTAVDLGPRGFDSEYGYGRVDAFAATALPLVQVHLRSSIDNSPVSGPVHPSPSGQFILRGQTGTFRLSGWVDVNNDGQIDPGDFYGEYPAPVIIPGRNHDLFLPLALLD